MRDTVSVLHVDDDPDFVALAAEFLQREAESIEVVTETSASAALERFDADANTGTDTDTSTDTGTDTGGIDCIVSDYDMPRMDGLELLEAVRERDPDFPFVLFTGRGSEEVAADAISAGVTDYLQKSGDPSAYTVLANRITNAVDQYRSKRAVEQREKILSLFVEQSPFGVIEWDDQFEVVRVNDEAEAILGYSAEDLAGEPWETIVPPGDRDAVGEVVDHLLEAQGGYHSVNENVRADGERIICEWHNRVVTDEDGQTVAIFSQFRDVTDRIERERDLELRDRAIDEAPIGVTITDPDQADNPIVFVNDRFVEYTGYSREEILGENHRILQGPATDEAAVAKMREAIDAGEPVTVELQNYRKDGEVWWNRVSIAPIRDDDGSIQHYVGFQEDVTERRESDERPLSRGDD